jgi:hypothetical protein
MSESQQSLSDQIVAEPTCILPLVHQIKNINPVIKALAEEYIQDTTTTARRCEIVDKVVIMVKERVAAQELALCAAVAEDDLRIYGTEPHPRMCMATLTIGTCKSTCRMGRGHMGWHTTMYVSWNSTGGGEFANDSECSFMIHARGLHLKCTLGKGHEGEHSGREYMPPSGGRVYTWGASDGLPPEVTP